MALIGLVEDEQLMRKSVARRLELEGHAVCAVETAEEGYDLVCRLQPDLVITDLRLPGMSGQELLVRIRRNYPDVGVIMITAHGSEVDAKQALAQGASDFLSKPLDLVDLGLAVERCLLGTAALAAASKGPIGRSVAAQQQES